jgi:hypothetical protein
MRHTNNKNMINMTKLIEIKRTDLRLVVILEEDSLLMNRLLLKIKVYKVVSKEGRKIGLKLRHKIMLIKNIKKNSLFKKDKMFKIYPLLSTKNKIRLEIARI